jgi:hypothetical protein
MCSDSSRLCYQEQVKVGALVAGKKADTGAILLQLTVVNQEPL